MERGATARWWNRLFVLAPPVSLFLALVLLRHQFVADLEMTYREALAFGIHVGWLYDVAAVLLIAAVTVLAGSLMLSARPFLWAGLSLVLWSSCLANLL